MSDYGYEIHTAVSTTAQMLQPDWTYLEQWVQEILERAFAEQREAIAKEIEGEYPDPSWYPEAFEALVDAADIARTFGQTGEDA